MEALLSQFNQMNQQMYLPNNSSTGSVNSSTGSVTPLTPVQQQQAAVQQAAVQQAVQQVLMQQAQTAFFYAMQQAPMLPQPFLTNTLQQQQPSPSTQQTGKSKGEQLC